MQARMGNTSGVKRDGGDGDGSVDEAHAGNDNDPVAPIPARSLDDDGDEMFEAVARLSNPDLMRREPEARITPQGWQTLSELVDVLASVAARVGIAIVPQLAASVLPKNVSAVSLKQPGLQRQIAAVWKKGGGLSPAGAELLEMAAKAK